MVCDLPMSWFCPMKRSITIIPYRQDRSCMRRALLQTYLSNLLLSVKLHSLQTAPPSPFSIRIPRGEVTALQILSHNAMADWHTLWDEPFKDRVLKLPLWMLEKRVKSRHSSPLSSEGVMWRKMAAWVHSSSVEMFVYAFKLQNIVLRAVLRK